MPIVISASRRTDIPAFYMPWFMSQIRQGSFEVTNPFNRKKRQVSATPEDVHTIVFWSKNFGPFLRRKDGEKLLASGYHLFFNFTINSASDLLEPNVPPLAKRLAQLDELARRFGTDGINLRFDPVCLFKYQGRQQDNLSDFSKIIASAGECGIKRVITSFVDLYAKVTKRARRIPGFAFEPINREKKKPLILAMKKICDQADITLTTCCEQALLDELPPSSGIKGAACIPNDLFMALFGGKVSLKKDYGQRVKEGCGCKTAVDIGAYDRHPCRHNCLFCYANPSMDTRVAPKERTS